MGQLIFNSYPFVVAANGSPTSTIVGEKFDYDALGRKTFDTKRYQPNYPSGSYSSNGGECTDTNAANTSSSTCTTAIAYDDRNHCRTQTVHRDSAASPQTQSCFESFANPDEERLTSVKDAAQAGSGGSWKYDYDIAGNLKTFTAPLKGGSRSFDYYATEFWLNHDISGPRGSVSITSYNAVGQVCEQTDARPVTTTFDRAPTSYPV